MLRRALSEAANVMLSRVQRPFALKQIKVIFLTSVKAAFLIDALGGKGKRE